MSGIVTDQDGNGIGNVTIAYDGEVSGTTITASSGRFEITGLLGSTTISAAKEGWVFSEPQVVEKASSAVNFTGQQLTYPLIITVQGDGDVKKTVLAIAQSSEYTYGTTVQLLAEPAEGWMFSCWEGDLSGNDNPTVITITARTEITAVFGRAPFSVSGIVTDPNGKGIEGVTITYTGEVSGTTTTSANGEFAISGLKGQTTISAAKEGWDFSEPTTVDIASDEIIFIGSKKLYPLIVETRGSGTVTETILVTVQSGDYEYGTSVELLAIPDDGWYFSHWEGAIEGNSNPAVITVKEETKVTAVLTGPAAISGSVSAKHHFPRSIIDNPPVSSTLKTIGSSTVSVNSYRAESDEIILTFDPDITEGEVLAVLKQSGFEVLAKLTILNAYLVKPAAVDPGVSLFSAQTLPGVRYAQPNNSFKSLSVTYPNDELFPSQWHYPLIRLPQAWSVTTGSDSVRIAVIDSGVDKDHPELIDQLDFVYGYNFVGKNTNFDDDNGHGTHVAGIIGAATNNSTGVAGIMWDVDLLPIKVSDSTGKGNTWDLANGILYAVGLLDEEGMPSNPYPADVINLSLGFYEYDAFMHEIIDLVLSTTNTLIVASAGNDSRWVAYPAAYDGVIAVGAVDYNYPNAPKLAPYSNWGGLDLVAPGGNMGVDSDGDAALDGVLSTGIGSKPSGYVYMQGTSMAAPHVTGVIGLMLSAGIPSSEVIDILHRTCIPLGSSSYYGYGLINAYWAVSAVDRMRIIVGTRSGELIEVVAETSVDPQGGTFEISDIPPGDYQVFAWVDVQPGSNRIEPGDYFAETELISFAGDQRYTIIGNVTEINAVGQEIEASLNVVQE